MLKDFNKLTELTTEYIKPVKIWACENATNTECLLTSDVEQVFLLHKEFCCVKKGGFIILDFGREISGGIRLLTYFCHDTIRIRFGESVGEVCSELREKNSTNAHSNRDFSIFVPNYSDQTFGQTGFRFVRIDNVGERDCKFVSAFASYTHLKQLPIGSFVCDNEEINRIYEAAQRTIFLNMQNNIWDGIKRDRLVWIGDLHPEMLGVVNLYGAHPLLENSLRLTAQQYPNAWICDLPSYSVWFIVILCDYFWYTGRWEFVQTLLPYVDNILSLLYDSIDKDGTLKYLGNDNYFICWEIFEESGLNCANRGLILYALKRLKTMLSIYGIEKEMVNELIGRLLRNPTFDATSKIAATIYGLGYGYENEMVKTLIAKGGCDGFSPFMSGYIARAMSSIGKTQEAFDCMRAFYYSMIEKGATTFWESFDLSWCENSCGIDCLPKGNEKNIHSDFGKHCYEGFRLSLCHGWACAPVWFFPETILGVKFLERGGKKISIQPSLCGLKKASGYVPTAYGNVFVSHEDVDGEIVTKYELPSGVELVK